MKRSVLDFESASFCDLTFPTGWFCQNILTIVAGNDSLCMTKDDICFTASSALDIHEIRIWGGDKSFKFMGLSLVFEAWVKQVSIHLLKYYDNIYIFMHLRCPF